MNDPLVTKIHKELEAKSTEELGRIYAERDTKAFADYAFIVARQIIVKRGRSDLLNEPPPNPSMGVLVFSCGLMAGFFMPWLQIFGVGVSGYQIGRFGSYGNYTWIIPVLAGVTILMSLARMPNRGIGALTGLVPIGALGYALARIAEQSRPRGTEQIFEIAQHVFSVGGYVTLACSVGLLLAAITSPAPVGAPVIPQPSANDKIGQLERLAKLREQGAITEAEFEAQKKQLLQ